VNDLLIVARASEPGESAVQRLVDQSPIVVVAFA
jgi:hypothetical protein